MTRATSPPPPAASTSPSWSQLPPSAPAPRSDAALVYDAKDGYVLLFGGQTAVGTGFYGDTWKYASGTWSQLHPTTSPAPRQGAAIAYDAADKYVVLYGGRNGTQEFSDTWKFSGGQWTKLAPAKSPGAAAWAYMGYDSNASETLLFGGFNSSGARATTWDFKAGAWSQLKPAKSPSARYRGAGAYDALDGWFVIFGGTTNGSNDLGQTWAYYGSTWHQISTAVAPTARLASAMAYDPSDDYLVLFGGLNATTGARSSDTWTFAGGLWTKIGPATTPSGRYSTSMATGPTNGSVTLFGGCSNPTCPSNDTWSYKGDVWSHHVVAHPQPRYYASMAYDEADGYVVLFGGAYLSATGYTVNLGDTWKFADGAWTELHPSFSPGPRYLAAMTYDAADGYVVLYGGTYAYNGVNTIMLNGTFTFVHGDWTQVTGTVVGPPSLVGASMTYDASDGYVVMFGGVSGDTGLACNQTWEFQNGAWTNLTGAVAPPDTLGATMVYDSADGYVLLLTYNGVSEVMETWTFLAGNWTNLTASEHSSPSDRYFAGMAYDSYDGYVLLYGGLHEGTNKNDPTITWSFVGGQWSSLNPAADPGARPGTSMAYYPGSDEVVLFGGETDLGEALGYGTWVY